MRLDFSNNHYISLLKQISAQSQQQATIYQNLHTPTEAFLMIVNGLPEEDLDNLCIMLKQNGSIYGEQDWYQVIQGNSELIRRLPKTIGELIYFTAKECIKKNDTVGSKSTPDGRFKTTSWISHSLYVAELAGNIAELIGEKREIAETLGILHDIGRKIDHKKHVTLGFELLADKNWINEAPITLTHSFINAGRCTWCYKAAEGFGVDEKGNPYWESEDYKDDIAKFLESYKYSVFDDIINIADLMATAKGIVSPSDRINDIFTRYAPDKTNGSLFLSELINKLIEFEEKMGYKSSFASVNPTKSIEALQQEFEEVSAEFYSHYADGLIKLKEKYH